MIDIRALSYALLNQDIQERLTTIRLLKNIGLSDFIDVSFDYPQSDFYMFNPPASFGTYSICSLCDYSQTLILCDDYLTDKRQIGGRPLAILDLNVISNINKSMRKQEYPSAVDGDNLSLLMEYLHSNQYEFILSPALGERAAQKGEFREDIQSDMIDNFMKYLNLSNKQDLHQIVSLSPDDTEKKRLLFDYSINYRSSYVDKYLDRHYLVILCLVTKAFIIKFIEKPNNPALELYNYCLKELVNLDPELTVLSLWLNNDERANKTFEKLQPGTKNIIEVLKNVSWDIYHLRLVESYFTIQRNDDTPDMILFPYFICRDIGLTRYFSLNPVIKLLVVNGTTEIIRKYSVKDFDLPFSSNKDIEDRINAIKEKDLKSEFIKLMSIIQNTFHSV